MRFNESQSSLKEVLIVMVDFEMTDSVHNIHKLENDVGNILVKIVVKTFIWVESLECLAFSDMLGKTFESDYISLTVGYLLICKMGGSDGNIISFHIDASYSEE